jgi:hypothetical protein
MFTLLAKSEKKFFALLIESDVTNRLSTAERVFFVFAIKFKSARERHWPNICSRFLFLRSRDLFDFAVSLLPGRLILGIAGGDCLVKVNTCSIGRKTFI